MYDFGRVLAATTGIPTTTIVDRAEALASGRVAGALHEILDSLWVACVALLVRDREGFTPKVKDLGAEIAEHLDPQWKALVEQQVEGSCGSVSQGLPGRDRTLLWALLLVGCPDRKPRPKLEW